MTDAIITCPKCATEIPLTESLAGPLLAETKRVAADRLRDALAEQKAQIEASAADAAAQAQADAVAGLRAEAAALRDRAAEQDAKLKEAQAKQAEALKRETQLADRERELDLTIQKQVAAQTDVVRKKLAQQAEALAAEKLMAEQEKAALRLAEKDQQMDGLRRQIETLQKKMEQGSQQLQGEVAEVVLEEQLGQAFPMDQIAPVGKGTRGADCLQSVVAPSGTAGAILWEVKRTANWSPGWLPKLREDMRAAGADVAVLASDARPDGVKTFRQIDGVWVAAPRHAIALAHVLRDGLLRVAEARGAREGQASKTEMLYDYLTGPQFTARVEAVVEPFEAMQAALLKEKKQMAAQWSTREKQLEKAVGAMMGMYGDVKGIAGSAVAQIEALEPDLLQEDADG
ncbi:MAG: DUF2130 domain-containing protein [Pseudomonadota bacterium]